MQDETQNERSGPSGEADRAEPVVELEAHIEHIAAAMTADERPISPDAVVETARLAVPHAEHVGITLLRAKRRPRSAAATDDVPVQLDDLQFDLNDGPCLDAAVGPPVIVTGDLGTDARWPLYGPRCVETTGIRSMLCLRLPLGGEDHAGMNFYSSQVDAFGEEDVTAGSLLIPFAALVLQARLHHEDVDNLSTALDSSRMIGTAIGILMATHRVDEDEAFGLLRRTSMTLNRKLRDVAADVTYSGDLPEGPPPRR